jgi:hypothetical protein
MVRCDTFRVESAILISNAASAFPGINKHIKAKLVSTMEESPDTIFNMNQSELSVRLGIE